MNGWEKAKTLSVLISSIAIPIVLALVGHWYTAAQNAREFGLQYVELAVSILAQEPQQHNRELRAWAADVINIHSSIKLPKNVKKDLTIKRLDITKFKLLNDRMGQRVNPSLRQPLRRMQ